MAGTEPELPYKAHGPSAFSSMAHAVTDFWQHLIDEILALTDRISSPTDKRTIVQRSCLLA